MSTSDEVNVACCCTACNDIADGEDRRCAECRIRGHGEIRPFTGEAPFHLIDDRGFEFVLRGTERVPYEEYRRDRDVGREEAFESAIKRLIKSLADTR